MKKNILLLTIIATLVSCGDFLEPKSKSEFVPKTASAMNELLLGEAYPTNSSSINKFLYLMDDDVDGAPYQEPSEGVETNIWLAPFTWQPNMFTVFEEYGLTKNAIDIYYNHYYLIKGANAVLDYIDGVKDDDTEMITNVKAQAHALRGFLYFNLVNIFAPPYNSNPQALGVVLKKTSGVEDVGLKRSTVEESYNFIEEEFLEAEKLYTELPEESQWKSNNRTSLPMVRLMLSRLYLYEEQWAKAAEYAKKVMDDTRFTLLDLNGTDDNKSFNFHSYTDSKENIWVFGKVDDVTNWVVNSYKGKETVNRPFFRASEGLMNCYDETEGDLRKTRYICYHQSYKIEDKDGNSVNMPLAYGKVALSTKNLPIGSGYYFGRSLRYAEAYLNYAEAEAMLYAENNNSAAYTEAVNALNNLRIRRIDVEKYEGVSFSSADELVAFVHNERRREFCFEDLRWFDLRRWGMPEIKHTWHPDAQTTIVYTLKKNDECYTVPLPNSALSENSELKQNTYTSDTREGTTE